MTDTPTINPIQVARLGQKLDVAEAAENAAISEETLRRWERGDVRPKMENFWTLANALCAEPNTLWSELMAWRKARGLR